MADTVRFKSGVGVPATANSPSAGPVYRSIVSKDGFPTLEDATTCWEIITSAASKYADKPCLGRREVVDGKAGQFLWQTYAEVFETAKAVGSAFRKVGMTAGGRVGIYGVNCPEWMISLEATNSQSLSCVPLYDTLGAEAVEFIIQHAEVACIVAQDTKLAMIISSLPQCTEHVKTVVSMGEWDAALKAKATALGVAAYSWTEFIEVGRANRVEAVPPPPSSICTLMYTSGTTGEPKGVLLSHAAIVSVIAGLVALLKSVDLKLDSEDAYLSYLPLAHIYERCALELNMYTGIQVGFWQGDVKQLTDDISELKPTYFNGVPRIYERIYAGIKSKVDSGSGLKRGLFNFFYNRKETSLLRGHPHHKAGPIGDAIVFKTVKARLGGRVRFLVSGAAPLAPHVETFLKVTMCAPVMQAYGLTESGTAGFFAHPDKIEQNGTVGPPIPGVDVRLVSVPDMKYDAEGTPPRGEICLQGPSLFSGYYKREDLTKEAVDADGWFHTGDVGEWQPSGCMKIIDRKKNIFKLSQGEYVAVEQIEQIYGNCGAVDQVWVYGNSFESVVVGVAVPNPEKVEGWAKEAKVEGTVEELCKHPGAQKFILEELGAAGKAGKLKGFEMLKAVHLEPVAFDMERDLITPTFKKKRPQLLKYYQTEIDTMYNKLRAAEAAKASAS